MTNDMPKPSDTIPVLLSKGFVVFNGEIPEEIKNLLEKLNQHSPRLDSVPTTPTSPLTEAKPPV